MSEAYEPQTPDQIWAGDVFDRQGEAEQLAAYIESVLGRPPLREDKRAFTIAIDGGYGIGKTFFLRRFAKHLAINHPVAFIDAWADDLADEPLTALAATLKEALRPFESEQKVASKIGTFMSKAGKVTAIAAKGLARRAIGLAITGGALDNIDGVLDGTTEAVKDAAEEGVKEAVNGVIDDAAGAIRDVTAHNLMQRRVAEFEEGRAAVQAMKDSLRSIVDALEESELHPPIVIVIDELDRCRPTYAIKLLEEIKHLFDVPGLVFLLGIHGDQLARSISGAYGTAFDGAAYLRRFIDRSYSLATPDLTPLLAQLCRSANINEQGITFPIVQLEQGGRGRIATPMMLSEYMLEYGLRARDAFQLVDVLQTSLALVDAKPLIGPYLVPLAIGQIQGLPSGALPEPSNRSKIRYPVSRGDRELSLHSLHDAAKDFDGAIQLNDSQLNELYGTTGASRAIDAIVRTRHWGANPLPYSDPARYAALLAAVGRFSNPNTSP